MLAKKPIHVLAFLLVSGSMIVGCDQNLRAGAVTVERDIVLTDGSMVRDWIVPEIVPVPASKHADLAGERPSNRHIWIPGEWKRDAGAWTWERGRWSTLPTPDASWMAGHWRMAAGSWHWTPGQWVVTGRRHDVSAKLAAPEPVVEPVPEKPSTDVYWITGHWDWDGGWNWVTGYWSDRPRPDAQWAAAHWDEYGDEGHFRWIGGHWCIKG